MKRCAREAQSRTDVSAQRSAYQWCPEPVYQSDPEPREHPRLRPPVLHRRARLLDFDSAGSSLTRRGGVYGSAVPAACGSGCASANAAYYILRDGTIYTDLGGDYVERRSKTQIAQRLVKRLESLGLTV